jgi:hypothetical protein
VQYDIRFYVSAGTIGDFNKDGKSDLAVVSNWGGQGYTASVLLGNGDGSFQPHVDYGTAMGPSSLAVDDFNSDGRPDLAVAHSVNKHGGGTVSVLLGKGDGTFLARVEYEAGWQPYGAAPGDFNRDGKTDLAVANEGNSVFRTVSVLLGRGDGTFQPHVDYETGTQPFSVAVEDFNRDGNQDLAVASSESDAVSILLGNGDGTFQHHVDYATSTFPFSVAVGDLNRDGAVDLVVANASCCIGPNTVSVLLGNGDGTFQVHKDYGTGGDPRSVAVADFNRDGKLDLATANDTTGTVSILLGRGDGTFPTHVDYVTGRLVISIVAGDFNSDSEADLAAVNTGDNTTSVLLGNGDGTFQSPVDYQTGPGPNAIAMGDFNRDGKADLVVANDNTVSVLTGNGDGTFRAATNYGTGYNSQSVAVGDLNDDHVQDLAVPNNFGNSVSILLNTGATL